MSEKKTQFKRDKWAVGKKYKIPGFDETQGLRSGTYASGLKYWSFPISFYETDGIYKNYYHRILFVVRNESCFVKPNDWVELVEVYSGEYKLGYNKKTGGKELYENIICKFKKLEPKEIIGEKENE